MQLITDFFLQKKPEVLIDTQYWFVISCEIHSCFYLMHMQYKLVLLTLDNVLRELYKIDKENGKCVKVTITRPQNRQQQKVTIRFSIQMISWLKIKNHFHRLINVSREFVQVYYISWIRFYPTKKKGFLRVVTRLTAN